MKHSRGTSITEILITLVVISAGLLAYVNMQRGIFREANLSSGRVAATELALAKLEDLRTFTTLYTTTGQFAYQDIAANAGGTLTSGTVTLDNISFSRTWTVTSYWYTTNSVAGTTTAPAGNPQPDFKVVTINVSWTDQNGATQSLALPATIAGIDPRFTRTVFY